MTPEPHPDLGPLRLLIGAWEGTGRGRWGDGQPFHYSEHLRFSHNGKPFLAYEQRTRALADGRPLHAESGYWRGLPEGGVELILAHPTGVAEIETGRWKATRLALRSVSMTTSPTAKRVTALERDIALDGDLLSYELRMAVDGGEARWHLAAELRRTSE